MQNRPKSLSKGRLLAYTVIGWRIMDLTSFFL